MTKKKRPVVTSHSRAPGALTGDEARERIVSNIQLTGQIIDTEGKSHPVSKGGSTILSALLSQLPEEYLLDQYYLAFGFHSLRELDLKVIRADMLIERVTRLFAESRAFNPRVIDELRQYSAVRNFAKAMTEPDEKNSVWVAAKHLADARNSVAHQLESPELEKSLTEFFKALEIPPGKNFENLETAVVRLSAQIASMKQMGILKKELCTRLYAQSQKK